MNLVEITVNEVNRDHNIPRHEHGEMSGSLVSKQIRQNVASSFVMFILDSQLTIHRQLNKLMVVKIVNLFQYSAKNIKKQAEAREVEAAKTH